MRDSFGYYSKLDRSPAFAHLVSSSFMPTDITSAEYTSGEQLIKLFSIIENYC